MKNFYTTPYKEDLLGDFKISDTVKPIKTCHINILSIIKILKLSATQHISLPLEHLLEIIQ